MISNKIYLDACIFVAYSHHKDERNKIVKNGILALEELDVEIYASDWCLAELVGVLVKDYGYQKRRAKKIAEEYRKSSKIGNLKINWISIDSAEKQSFEDFFYYLKEQTLDVKDLHIADAIHSLIMKNNDIVSILTTDNDFNAIKGVASIHPSVLLILRPKKNL